MIVKTYENFLNIFNKNYKNILISALVKLTKQVFKDCTITVKNSENFKTCKDIIIDDSEAIDEFGYKYSTGRKPESWCHIESEKNNEYFISFNPTSHLLLNDFISMVLQSVENKKKHPTGEPKTDWGKNMTWIPNDKIPEIIKELTIENYEAFEDAKKYNL